MRPRRNTFGVEGRQGKLARAESTDQPVKRLAPADPIKPYEYGASAPKSRPQVPPKERADRPAADKEPTLSSLTPTERRAAQVRQQRSERLTERIGRRVRTVKMMLERPVRRAPEDPSLRDELEYIGIVSRELLDELDSSGSVSEPDALSLLRAAESMWALVTQVEIVEEEVEVA
ncbi:hypothetical protein AB0465_18465 [Streptomyces griseoviridis]|uniref:hypothetical protein n=1 Tax=Streptomyces griseoviridis TaxID=45398 RepID=UPI00344E9936